MVCDRAPCDASGPKRTAGFGADEPGMDPQSDWHFQLFPPEEQKEKKHSAANQFFRDIWTDQKAIWTSPFHLNKKQAATIVLPLAAVTAGLIATDSQTSKFLANTRDKWSGRSGSPILERFTRWAW